MHRVQAMPAGFFPARPGFGQFFPENLRAWQKGEIFFYRRID
jgi:hypothetical protein